MQALAAAAIVLQDNSTLTADVHSLMIAQWITAICILIVILGLLGTVLAVYLVVRGLQKKVEKLTKEAQAKAMPLIGQGQDLLGKVQEIIADLKPKIASVTADVTEMTGVIKGEVAHITEIVHAQADHISGIVHEKADEISATVTKVNTTVQDVNGKTKDQVQRVNGMVSEALTTTEHVSRSIQNGIKVPVLKVVGWVAAAKAGIETLAEKVPFLHQVTEVKPVPGPKPVISKDPDEYTGPPYIPSPSVNKPKF